MTMISTRLLVNPDTGMIHRVYKNGETRVAGYSSERGYRYLSVNNKNRAAHQVIWEFVNGEIPHRMEIDHIDGDPSNNRIDNLRLVTHGQNMQNQHHPRSNNKTSGVKGVHWDKDRGCWRTHIVIDGRQKYLGRYSSLDDATRVYRDAASRFHTHNPHAEKSS